MRARIGQAFLEEWLTKPRKTAFTHQSATTIVLPTIVWMPVRHLPVLQNDTAASGTCTMYRGQYIPGALDSLHSFLVYEL